jgi:hypothetical protein
LPDLQFLTADRMSLVMHFSLNGWTVPLKSNDATHNIFCSMYCCRDPIIIAKKQVYNYLLWKRTSLDEVSVRIYSTMRMECGSGGCVTFSAVPYN